jgi:PAS domain S-box-containing protein
MHHTRRVSSSSRPPPASSGVHASLIDLNVVGGVLAAAEVGVWQFFGAGQRLLASSTALHIFGLEDGEDFDAGADSLGRVHPADRERVAVEVERSRAEAGPFAVELRILTPGGETRWLDVHGTSVHDDIGFAHACGTVQDVTSRKEQELFRELLLVTLSHDLRNPLTAIQIGAGLLLRRGRLGESDSSTAQRVLASAGRISAMVEQLLDFTRIRVSGTLPCVRRPGNLGIIVAKVIDEMERENPGRSFELSNEGELDGVWDVDRLGQMIANLVANALTHGDSSSPITLGIAARGEAVKLTVHNHGAPIDAEDIEAIFNPFKRAAHPAARSGLGLGLFIAHEVVRAHGGSMRVASSREAGTRFTVHLPRRAE